MTVAESLGIVSCFSLVEFLQDTILLLGIGDVTSHFGQSHWIPTQLSTEERDLAVMVLLVMVFTKPNDVERIRVVLVMRNDVTTTTDDAAASAQHAPFDQAPGLLANFLPQENQGVLDLLSLSELPFREKWRRLFPDFLSVKNKIVWVGC